MSGHPNGYGTCKLIEASTSMLNQELFIKEIGKMTEKKAKANSYG